VAIPCFTLAINLTKIDDNNSHLMVILHDNPSRPVTEYHHSGCYWSTDGARMTETVVTTGAIRRGKLRLKSSPTTYRPDALPVAQQHQVKSSQVK